MNIKNALFQASQKLSKYSPTPDLDTEILLSFVFKKNRSYLYSCPEKKLTKLQIKKFNAFIRRRQNLEPIAYIVGQKEFYGLNFYVDKNVLVPRPDTEVLVDEILKLFDTNFFTKNSLRVLDMGTGSGCIAVTLKKHLLKANIIATDVCKKALNVARKNAGNLNREKPKKLEEHESTKIKFYYSDLFSQLPKKYQGKLDIIIFNPPYLTKNEARKKSLRHEPQVALTPKSFSKLMNNFFTQSLQYVSKNGIFFIEIGHKQANMIKKIAKKYYPQAKINVIKDLGGFDRVIKIKIN